MSARRLRLSAFEPELVVTKVIDYFQNTNKAPRKKERQQILAHIKELGSTEAKDISIINWFNNRRRQDEKFRPSLLSAPAPELSERKWANAHHKARKLLIPSQITPSLATIRTLTEDRWRFSLAITHKGDVKKPRVTVFRAPNQR